MAGDRLVMGVCDSDARLEGVSRQVLALANLERMRAAIAEYRQARSGAVLLRGGLKALGATLVLAAAVGLVLWLMRRLSAGLEGRIQRQVQSLEARSFQIVRYRCPGRAQAREPPRGVSADPRRSRRGPGGAPHRDPEARGAEEGPLRRYA